MAQTAIIIPLMRPWRIEGLLQNIAETTEDYSVCVIATGECAEATKPFVNGLVKLVDDGGGTWPNRMNLGYRETTEPYFFLGSDDSRFHPNWLVRAMEAMRTVDGVVMVEDLYNPCGTLALVSRRYIDEESGVPDEPRTVIHPGYGHCYSEIELERVANRRGRYVHCRDSIVEHLFWGAGKSPHDETYAKGASTVSQDFDTHMRRSWMWTDAEPDST